MRYEVVLVDTTCSRCGRAENYVILDRKTREKICPSCLTERERVYIKLEVENRR